MRYERFLFTRNQRRDFTAFIRPARMTNKDVSVLANAFNYVNDITPLTPERPALYCFPLGAYLVLLRHYDSGRTHAGRAIPVIEGIAVDREVEREFHPALAVFAARHDRLLNMSAGAGDAEALEIARPEPVAWDGAGDGDEPAAPDSDEAMASALGELAARYARERLVLPFDDAARALLLAALGSPRLPVLHVAFGTNRDVVESLAATGVDFDVVGLLSAATPEYRPRPAPKAVDVGELLPDAARVPTEFAASSLVPAEAADLERVSEPVPVVDTPPLAEPVPVADAAPPLGEPDFLQRAEPIQEERERRRYRPVRKSLLRRVLDILFG